MGNELDCYLFFTTFYCFLVCRLSPVDNFMSRIIRKTSGVRISSRGKLKVCFSSVCQGNILNRNLEVIHYS